MCLPPSSPYVPPPHLQRHAIACDHKREIAEESEIIGEQLEIHLGTVFIEQSGINRVIK